MYNFIYDLSSIFNIVLIALPHSLQAFARNGL